MWAESRYLRQKQSCKDNISRGSKTAPYYMKLYKECISKEDYESAKAIAEVLEPLSYDVCDTHQHIKEIN